MHEDTGIEVVALHLSLSLYSTSPAQLDFWATDEEAIVVLVAAWPATTQQVQRRNVVGATSWKACSQSSTQTRTAAKLLAQIRAGLITGDAHIVGGPPRRSSTQSSAENKWCICVAHQRSCVRACVRACYAGLLQQQTVTWLWVHATLSYKRRRRGGRRRTRRDMSTISMFVRVHGQWDGRQHPSYTFIYTGITKTCIPKTW